MAEPEITELPVDVEEEPIHWLAAGVVLAQIIFYAVLLVLYLLFAMPVGALICAILAVVFGLLALLHDPFPDWVGWLALAALAISIVCNAIRARMDGDDDDDEEGII